MWTYPGLIEVASSTSPAFLLPFFRPMEFNAKLNVAHPTSKHTCNHKLDMPWLRESETIIGQSSDRP